MLGLRDCVDGVDDALKGGDLAAAAQAIHKCVPLTACSILVGIT